jgi:hypothetical protein
MLVFDPFVPPLLIEMFPEDPVPLPIFMLPVLTAADPKLMLPLTLVVAIFIVELDVMGLILADKIPTLNVSKAVAVSGVLFLRYNALACVSVNASVA